MSHSTPMSPSGGTPSQPTTEADRDEFYYSLYVPNDSTWRCGYIGQASGALVQTGLALHSCIRQIIRNAANEHSNPGDLQPIDTVLYLLPQVIFYAWRARLDPSHSKTSWILFWMGSLPTVDLVVSGIYGRDSTAFAVSLMVTLFLTAVPVFLLEFFFRLRYEWRLLELQSTTSTTATEAQGQEEHEGTLPPPSTPYSRYWNRNTFDPNEPVTWDPSTARPLEEWIGDKDS
ncbi:hypothetical protein F5Y16DRAFT_381471 [Xylariaceae sp. FL0255]|nr:hypothetical protein F5Y16DRAFT_381471 [Xylariaceae sp. FL0255]